MLYAFLHYSIHHELIQRSWILPNFLRNKIQISKCIRHIYK